MGGVMGPYLLRELREVLHLPNIRGWGRLYLCCRLESGQLLSLGGKILGFLLLMLIIWRGQLWLSFSYLANITFTQEICVLTPK